MRKFILPILVAGSVFAASPATAGHNSNQPGVRAVQQQIGQLHNRIATAQQRGRISRREANGLRRQAATVQRNLHVLSRNGLTRREFGHLQSQVRVIRNNVRVERADYDRRRG